MATPIKALLLCALFMTPLSAQTSDLELLGGDFTVGYEGEINTNATTNSSNHVNFQESYVSLNATWKQKVRAVLTAKINHLMDENGASFNEDFDLGEFIEEAYIEIREVGGSPVALVIGKQPVAFGQNVQAAPLFGQNPLGNVQSIDEVYGFTVDLTEGLFGLFDQVEISAFETEGGDLNIGTIDGMSIRLTKMLTDNILATVSHAEMGNSHLDTGHERRTSIGLIAESNDGMLVGWIEGVYFSNNPNYVESNYGITVGGMIRVHRTTDVIVEYNYVEKELSQYVIGTRTALTQSWSLGVEVRYNDYRTDQDDEVVFGVNVSYAFGSNRPRPNEEYLFGDD